MKHIISFSKLFELLKWYFFMYFTHLQNFLPLYILLYFVMVRLTRKKKLILPVYFISSHAVTLGCKLFFSLNKVGEKSYFQTNLEKCTLKKKKFSHSHSRQFTSSNSFNIYMSFVWLSVSFCRGKWGTGRLSNFLKATELVKSRARVQTQAVQQQSLCTESSWFLVGSMDLHSFWGQQRKGMAGAE